jgi:hypothetical protein
MRNEEQMNLQCSGSAAETMAQKSFLVFVCKALDRGNPKHYDKTKSKKPNIAEANGFSPRITRMGTDEKTATTEG